MAGAEDKQPVPGSGTSPFRLDVERRGTGVLLIVEGEVDLATAPLVVREVKTALAEPITSLAVDLGGVTFLDSSGIQALLTTRRAALDHGLRFTLTAVSRAVQQTFEANGLGEELGLGPGPS